MRGWITEGEEHPENCPICGRRYKGEYDPENLTIKAVEVEWDKIGKFINETLEMDCINSLPIEWFTAEQLGEIAKIARKNDLMMCLRDEHSNFHQGVLVQLIKKDIAEGFIKFL